MTVALSIIYCMLGIQTGYFDEHKLAYEASNYIVQPLLEEELPRVNSLLKTFAYKHNFFDDIKELGPYIQFVAPIIRDQKRAQTMTGTMNFTEDKIPKSANPESMQTSKLKIESLCRDLESSTENLQ